MNYNQDTRDIILKESHDFVIDAFDMYKQKADLVIACSFKKQKVIHALGAANRFNPSQFYITTLDKAKGDYLAKGMRKELLRLNKDIRRTKVVCSTENGVRRTPPASLAFTPFASGNLIANYVFNKLIQD